jgi:hypothetical protein
MRGRFYRFTCKECPAEHERPVSMFPIQLLVVAPVDEALGCGQVVVVAKYVVDVPGGVGGGGWGRGTQRTSGRSV